MKAGKVPWSPEYKIIVDAIDFWQYARKWKNGCNSSRQIMKRLATKIGIKWNQVRSCSLELVEKKLFESWKKYYSEKKEFKELQKEFQQSYIDVLAKEAHVPKVTMEKCMK